MNGRMNVCMVRDKRHTVGQASHGGTSVFPLCPWDKTGQASQHGTSVTRWDKRHNMGQAAPPVSGSTVPPVYPASRGDRVPRPASGLSAVRPCRRIPATVRAVRFRSIASRALVAPRHRSRRALVAGKPSATIERRALVAPWLRRPGCAAGFRRTSERRHHRKRATVRPRRRIRHHRRKRAENALASRPPSVPCPRPSEMRRAFCKPFSTACNAGKDSPASPAPPSASRPPFAPWLRRPSATIAGNAA